MPREYYLSNDSFGTFYDWYASTAETGLWTMASHTATADSICPLGWTLPTDQGDKSWEDLLYTNYELTDNSEDSIIVLGKSR